MQILQLLAQTSTKLEGEGQAWKLTWLSKLTITPSIPLWQRELVLGNLHGL